MLKLFLQIKIIYSANIWTINYSRFNIVEKNNLNLIRKDLKIVYSDNNSISLVFQDNRILMGVVGELDSNITGVIFLLLPKKLF